MEKVIKTLQKGDPCPCCGQPIKTDDPDVLALLTEIRNQGFPLIARITLEMLERNRERREQNV